MVKRNKTTLYKQLSYKFSKKFMKTLKNRLLLTSVYTNKKYTIILFKK